MKESSVSPLFQLRAARSGPVSGCHPHTSAVLPSSRTEPRMVIEDNEVLLSLMEILPDYSRCGINE